MAVIREKRQYLSQPIGVVRANVGDVEGAKSLNQFADTLLAGSYKALIQDAEQKGTEAAQALDSSSLRTINPETQMPEAFTAPPQFGRVASRAYQSLVERRYVTDVEADLKAASAKYFAENYYKPDGFDAYSKEMRSYAESTVEGALPRFKNIVTGVSSAIVASTEAEFVKRKTQREREEMALNLENTGANELQSYGATLGTIDISDEDKFDQSISSLEGTLQPHFTAQHSGIIDIEQRQNTEKTAITSHVSGITQNLQRIMLQSQGTQNPLTANDITSLEQVIEANGAGKENLDKRLQPFVDASINLKLEFTKLGDDGKETTVTRNYSGAVREGVLGQLGGIYTNANRQETERNNALNDEQKNDALSFQLGLNDPFDGGINNIISDAVDMIDADGLDAAFKNLKGQADKIQTDALNFRDADGNQILSNDTINTARGQILKGFLKSVGDKAFSGVIPFETEVDGKKITLNRPMNGIEADQFRRYVDRNETGVELDDLPEAIRPYAKMVRDNLPATMHDDVMISINQKVQKAQQRTTQMIQSIEDQNTVNAIVNGAGDNNEKSREAVDRVKNIPDTPHFFLSDDGFAAFTPQFAQENSQAGFIISDNLRTTAIAVAEGRFAFSPEQINRFFTIFDTLSDRDTPLGDNIDAFKNSLTDAQYTTLKSIHATVKGLEGSKDAYTVYAEMRSRLDGPDDEFDALMTKVTGTTTGVQFVKDTVGEDNLLAVNHFIPLIKYMVATNPDAASISKQMKNMLDREFMPTDGYVYDPRAAVSFGTEFRSRDALRRHIPSYSDRIQAVQKINQYLASIGVNFHIPRQERYIREMGDTLSLVSLENRDLMDRMSQGLSTDSRAAFLVPMTGAGPEGESIYVLSYRDKNGHVRQVERTDENGNMRHIHFSVNDLKKAVAPDEVTTTGNPLMDEMIRQEMMKQGTSNPIIPNDMSTIALDPEFTPMNAFEGVDFNTEPVDKNSWTYWLQNIMNDTAPR